MTARQVAARVRGSRLGSAAVCPRAVGQGRRGLRTGGNFIAAVVAVVVLGLGVGVQGALAQRAADSQDGASTPALQPAAGFGILQGRWVRPDGGYVITIRAADAGGKLDASYANPAALPFSKAEAAMEGGALMVFLELRAGGYNGSTYTLTYDPARDVLKGVYYQAVARQVFDVYFVRAK